jgi:hypothetical protein
MRRTYCTLRIKMSLFPPYSIYKRKKMKLLESFKKHESSIRATLITNPTHIIGVFSQNSGSLGQYIQG